MSILDLPGELYFLIAEHLTSPRDLKNLLLAHRGLAMFIAPVLFKYACAPEYALAALFSFAASRNAARVKSHLEELRKQDPDITTDVESIISQGPNLSWVTCKELEFPQRALHWAIVNSKFAMIRYLISQGAEIDYRDPKTGGKAIDLAIRQGSVEIVKILIESGADVSAWEIECGSLLHCTIFEYMRKKWPANLKDARAAYEEILVLLLKGGADISLFDMYGHTALHLVVFNWTEAIPILLEWGADINAQDSFGNTPLHLATQIASSALGAAPNMKSAETLQAMGADVTIKNDSGREAGSETRTHPLLAYPVPTNKELRATFVLYVQRLVKLGEVHNRYRFHSNCF